ncbi:hypothetical protein MTO96_012248 [Rhipicephalus appendiculatus]
MLHKVCMAYVILCSLQTVVRSAGSDLNRVAHHENLLKHLFDPREILQRSSSGLPSHECDRGDIRHAHQRDCRNGPL